MANYYEQCSCGAYCQEEPCYDCLKKENEKLREMARAGKSLVTTYITENQDLRAQLTDTQAALAEAVGALEESIGIVKGGDCRARNCPECELKYCNLRDLLKRVNCIIQSTAAKAAGERWRAMERVVEAARAYTCNPGNRLDHYHRLCAAVAAYEMEVGQ